MRSYTETTDGSNIEAKESALVWHHQDADPDFGTCQAKELLDHLESVLANEPVVVKRGQHIVEVKPQVCMFSLSLFFVPVLGWFLECLTLASTSQGVTKGLVAEKVLSAMISNGKQPDFVMCIGDDRSDEDMFESISSIANESCLPAAPEIFACTVGQKPSKARYYLDDTVDVVKLLQGLATASVIKPRCSSEIQVSFQDTA